MLDLPRWLAVLSLPVLGIVYTVGCLLSNYLAARKVGVPVIVVPVNPESPFWMLISDAFGSYIDYALSWIPIGSGTFARYAHRGWDVHDKAKTFEELGDTFILVTTGKNWLYVCNADAFTEILQRRADFKRPLEIMGSCLSRATLRAVMADQI